MANVASGGAGTCAGVLSTQSEGWARGFGLAAAPSGETHRMDWNSTIPFQMNGGNNTWGTPIQIIGSEDTPFDNTNTRFRITGIFISDAQRTATLTQIQFACGETPNWDNTDPFFTGFYAQIIPTLGNAVERIMVDAARCTKFTKVWARCWVSGQPSGTIDFFASLIEYP